MKTSPRYILGIGSLAIAVIIVHGRSAAAQTVALPDSAATWQLVQQTLTETSQTPPYDITINQPILEATVGNPVPFNQAVQAYIDQAKADLKQNAASAADLPSGARNYLILTDDVFATDNGLISVRFMAEEYTGGAHPAHAIKTINYDLNSGKVLTLADLFKPSVNYLTPISAITIADLTRQNRLSFPDGAAPKAENYANWNLDHGGLLFSFDEYQVGPYAQGISQEYVSYSDPTVADLFSDSFMQSVFSHKGGGS